MAETRAALDVDDLLANADWLRILAARVLHDESEVDDLVHEVWLAALRRPAGDVRDLSAWLAAVVKNLCRRRLRHLGRVEALPQAQELALEDAGPGPAEAYDLESVRRRVADAVLDLPEPFRVTILLSFFEGLPAQEIAQRLGIPHATVRTRLRRALLRLRAKLGAEGGPNSACAGLILLALPIPAQAPPAPAPLNGPPNWFGQAALPLVAGVLGLFTLAVWSGFGPAGEPGRAAAAGAGQPGVAAERSLAPAPPSAPGLELLLPSGEAEQNTGSVQEDLSQCGAGPLLGRGVDLASEEQAGRMPQPALVDGQRQEARAPAGVEPARAAHQEGRAAFLATPQAASGLGASILVPGDSAVAAAPGPVHFSARTGSWSRSAAFGWTGRQAAADEEEDERDGSGPGARHALTSGDPLSDFDTRAKTGAGDKEPSLLPGEGDAALEWLCSCHLDRRESHERPRAMRIGPGTRTDPEQDQRALECALHPHGPEGPAAIPVLTDGRVVVLVEWGQPERAFGPLLPAAIVLAEWPREPGLVLGPVSLREEPARPAQPR